jgi:purine-binding chemotaxis protein CheW
MRDMADASDEAQYVTLCLGAEVFAVPVTQVREILDYRDAFRIPECPDYMLGLIDVRDHGTPVIDLRLKLGLPKVPPTPATRIMVLDVPLADRVVSLGMVADRVLEVANIDTAQIEGIPDVGVAWRSDYIAGVVRSERGFVVLFDLPKLLVADENLLASASEAAELSAIH